MTILSQLSCHVLAILSSWSCPGLSVRLTSLDWPALAVSCLRSRPGCPVMAVCRICPVLVALSQLSLSCPSCHFLAVCPAMVVLSCLSFITVLLYLSCHACPATVVLSQLPTPAGLSHLSCPRYLSQHSCPPVFLSPLSCQYCHDLTVMSKMSCPGCIAIMSMLSCAGRPVLSLSSPLCLSSLTCPDWLFKPTCPGWHVSAVLFWISCPGCPVLAVLSRLFCLSPVPAVLSKHCSLLSCSCHPLFSVLSRLTWSGRPFRPNCPGCPFPAVMPWLSCPWLSYQDCPVSVVLSHHK